MQISPLENSSKGGEAVKPDHYKWLWWLFWGLATDAAKAGNLKLESVYRDNMTQFHEKHQAMIGLRKI
jgi:hypothetical protein